MTPENAELLAESAGHLERSPLTGRSPHLPRLSPLESHRYAVAGQVRAVSAAAALHRHHAERDPAQRGSEATGSASQAPLTFFECECYLTIVPLIYSRHSLNIYSKNVVSKARDVMR
jgi:hypothetical protein